MSTNGHGNGAVVPAISPWRFVLLVAAWVLSLGLFAVVVMLALKSPAGIMRILDYRWLLWAIGAVEVALVVALRFVRAWNEPLPAAATTAAKTEAEAGHGTRATVNERPVWPERVFSWLFAYPLFPLQIAIFCAISWLGFGEGLGLPNLVWEDTWPGRFFAGLSVSLLFGNVLFIRALLDRRPGNTPPDFGERISLFPSHDPEIRRVGAFLFWTWLPALALFYVPKMFAWNEWKAMNAAGSMFCGLVAGVLVTVLIWVMYEFLWHDGWAERQIHKLMPAFHGANPLPGSAWPLHSLAGLISIYLPALCLGLFLIEHLLADAVWSPVWLLCMILAVFNSAYGFVTFQLAGLQYVLVVLAGLVVYVSNTEYPDKMTFPGLDDPQMTRPDLNGPPLKSAQELELIDTPALLKTFHEQKWAQGIGRGKTPLEHRKPKLVIVCTTGGGIQAAVWTAVVLEGLEKHIPGEAGQKAAFRDHIRLITGASGGMQAAGLYAADFSERISNVPLHQQLARDSLWPTVQTMLVHDFPGLAWPKQFHSDRGRSLEYAWERNSRPWRDKNNNPCEPPNWWGRAFRDGCDPPASPLAKTFWEMRETEKTCDRPSLIFSPMLVEDCRRVLISNLDLDWFTATKANHINPTVSYANVADQNTISIPAIELWKYFPDARQKFKVATAARMSATFPFVGPAVSLPSNPPRRVVDAGYFDNFGINLAAMWLYRYREEIKAHTSGVVIVEVRAYKRRAEKLRFELGNEDENDSKAELFTWAASELSSPLEAIINLYARGAYFRNDQLLHILDREFNVPPCSPVDAPPEKRFFATVVFECEQPAALSWTLPARDAKKLREQFENTNGTLHGNVAQQVAALRRWFGDGGTKAPVKGKP